MVQQGALIALLSKHRGVRYQSRKAELRVHKGDTASWSGMFLNRQSGQDFRLEPCARVPGTHMIDLVLMKDIEAQSSYVAP